MAFKIVNRENQEVFIGSGQVYGAQALSYSWQIPEAPLEFVGQSNSIVIPQGPQVGDFSLRAFVVDTDPFVNAYKVAVLTVLLLMIGLILIDFIAFIRVIYQDTH